MDQGIVCRKLAAADAVAVAALERACFSLPWSEAQLRSSFGQHSFAAFGLFIDGLVAYISLYHVVDEMEILNLAVLPRYRCRGHGRFLLETALRAGKKIGMNKVWLEVREGNTPARTLYARCGFTTEGVRAHYYADTGEDALLLARVL